MRPSTPETLADRTIPWNRVHAWDPLAHEPKSPPGIRTHHPRPAGLADAGRVHPRERHPVRRDVLHRDSANPGAQFTAAADLDTVAVALTNPGSPLKGSVMVTATAASDRGITSVVFSSAPAGTSTWTVACTKTVPPYTCTFDTTTVSDGLRDVRAVATDSAGYSRTDTVLNRRVDNTAPIATTTDPGSPLTGTVTVAGSAADGGSGPGERVARVPLDTRRVDEPLHPRRPQPISCAWNTTSLADGLWDLRTVATDVAGNQTISAPVFNRRVDNTAPTVSLTDPGTPLKGTVTLASTTGDGAGSGVSSVRYEYKLGAGAWTTACTGATTPFSCALNTGSVADGLYDFRAIATDGVAKVTTSAAVTARRIDNAAPTVATLGAVATPIQGTVALTGTATDPGSGVASLRFQYAPAGTSTWTDICTATLTPYTCSFDTTVPADALYDLRTLATDSAGNTTASADADMQHASTTTAPTLTLTNPRGGRKRARHPLSAGRGRRRDNTQMHSVARPVPRQSARPPGRTLCTDTNLAVLLPRSTRRRSSAAPRTSPPRQGTDTLAKTTTTAPGQTVTVDNVVPTGSQRAGHQRRYPRRRPRRGRQRSPSPSPSQCSPVSILAGWDGSADPHHRCTSITPAASTPSTSMTPRTQRRQRTV